MEFTVFEGRPEKEEGRLEKEIRTYDLLDRLGVKYSRIDHEALMTMEACAGVDQLFHTRICKNLFLSNTQKTFFYLLLMPGDKKFKTKELSGQLGGARLSFGDETFMEKFLNLTPGSVTVMGLMNDKEKRVRLLIDEDVVKEEYFACHPCINTSSICFSTKDFLEKVLPALGHDVTYVKLGLE